MTGSMTFIMSNTMMFWDFLTGSPEQSGSAALYLSMWESILAEISLEFVGGKSSEERSVSRMHHE